MAGDYGHSLGMGHSGVLGSVIFLKVTNLIWGFSLGYGGFVVLRSTVLVVSGMIWGCLVSTVRSEVENSSIFDGFLLG